MTAEGAFIEEEIDRPLESRFFPNKIGGRPAWLDLKNLPSVSEILCDVCGLPRHFLCQLYSPIEEKDTAFHRTIFIFVCLSETCFQLGSSKNFIVFRNQLPRYNPFYPAFAEGIEDRTDINCSNFGCNLCSLCGIKGEIQCERCENNFCSVHHQKFHTERCSISTSESFQTNQNLLPEFGLSDPEDLSDIVDEPKEQIHNSEDVAEICQKFSQFNSPQDDAMLKDIFENCSEMSHDKTFLKFRSQLSCYPDLIIRFSRNNPLWFSDQHQPTADLIPFCENCNSPREFEFQVLPQLLNYLNLDKRGNLQPGVLDWGILAVYTCKNSCDEGPAYKKEFLWKQDLL